MIYKQFINSNRLCQESLNGNMVAFNYFINPENTNKYSYCALA